MPQIGCSRLFINSLYWLVLEIALKVIGNQQIVKYDLTEKTKKWIKKCFSIQRLCQCTKLGFESRYSTNTCLLNGSSNGTFLSRLLSASILIETNSGF